MAAFLIALVDEVFDGPGIQDYAGKAGALMANYGGRYICASFTPEAIEGGDKPAVVAIAEFASMEDLRAFWASKEYKPLREQRHRAARVRVIFADAAPLP